MTDKKLLELAAKAIGIDELRGAGFGRHCYYVRDDQPVKWNALVDDGDALRLAVKLGLLIEVQLDNQKVVVWDSSDEERRTHVYWGDATEAACKTSYEATRRAIVIAAAAIRKAPGEA